MKMSSKSGANQQTVKAANRGLVLEQVLCQDVTSRAEIARTLGLTKTTLTNITNELIAEEILTESELVEDAAGRGRRAIRLKLSPQAPKICGVLIQRGNWQVIIADLKGHIIKNISYKYSGLVTVEFFKGKLQEMLKELLQGQLERILAVGVSCLGPLNIKSGKLLSPTNFFTCTQEFGLVEFIEEVTDLPVHLCNDATAGALAEKLFGQGKNEENFMYISTLNGIGAGFYLDNKLYNGECGQNGELGHMSINFMGPQCECGNRGCLELYADVQRICAEQRVNYPEHKLWVKESVTILDMMELLEEDDPMAKDVMTRYCEYLSCAVSNLITQLNINRVILTGRAGHFMVSTLESMINQRSLMARYQPIKVSPSELDWDAPLYGSVGIVLEKIFKGEELYEK